MQTPLTIGYFHNDYGHGAPSPLFLRTLEHHYPHARIVNCAISCPEHLAMAARTQAYAQLRRSMVGDLILLDTDIIAGKPVDVFETDGWDIGVTRTLEETPLMRYNGGVIFLRDSDVARSFMADVQYHATVVPEDFGPSMWYVDQLALTYVAKGNPRVKAFTGEYNYVPKTPRDTPEIAYFLHYKGKKRKAWLRDLEAQTA